MKDILLKTFGGLNKTYYFRQLFFGLLFFCLFLFPLVKVGAVSAIVVTMICTLLYPYSRFVYESIVYFIIGENVYYLPATVMLLCKFLSMSMCWSFAIFIAPLGLVFLYFYHSKSSNS